MLTLTFKLLKPLALGFALIALFAVGQKTARADEVVVAGFTNGCFGAACVPPTTSAQQTASIFALVYNNSQFNGTTSSGFLGLGNTGQPPGTQNVDNLGSFTLGGGLANYNGQSFTLRVTFTAPPSAGGGTFNAMLTGNVTANDVGGVFIDFNNTPQLFTFSFVDGSGRTQSGSFSLTVNDVSVIAGGTVGLTGQITGASQTALPEPTTMLLLGTGLAGLAGGIRRRRAARV